MTASSPSSPTAPQHTPCNEPTPGMTVQLFRVNIPVSDIERSAAVYAELLGTPGARVSPLEHE